MTDAIQISSVTAAAAARPVAKRSADTALPVPADIKPQAHTDSARPVEPVVPVEPSTRLTITRDDGANAFVYRSINADTGEVVWQYPVEQVLRMAHRLRQLEGLDAHRLDQKV